MKLPPALLSLGLLIAATGLEVTGDALIRKGLYDHAGAWRIGLFVIGIALLAGYGTLLNLAPLEFGQVVGLYVATLFVMWQLINFVIFRTVPTMPICLGGAMIVAGGLVVSFMKAAP
jgi:small multidrug resistance family-3 protein